MLWLVTGMVCGWMKWWRLVIDRKEIQRESAEHGERAKTDY